MSQEPTAAVHPSVRATVRALYVTREAGDTNEGRRSAKSCPCLRLLVVFADTTFDGDQVWWMLCPPCQSGWVREVPREHALATPFV